MSERQGHGIAASASPLVRPGEEDGWREAAARLRRARDLFAIGLEREQRRTRFGQEVATAVALIDDVWPHAEQGRGDGVVPGRRPDLSRAMIDLRLFHGLDYPADDRWIWTEDYADADSAAATLIRAIEDDLAVVGSTEIGFEPQIDETLETSPRCGP